MLDNDVAKLYHYETRNINKAVKRNIDRFPEDFCFQLTENEFQVEIIEKVINEKNICKLYTKLKWL